MMGTGYLFLVVPLMVAALVAVVPAEAWVLSRVLRLRLGAAMRLSLRANLRSTLWVLGLAIAIDLALIAATGSMGPAPTRAAAWAMLLPLFAFSWWIEHRTVKRSTGSADAESGTVPIAAATGAANLLSFALIGVIAGLLYPAHDLERSRALISEGIVAAGPLKAAVGEQWASLHSFPTARRELRFPQEAPKYRIALESSGRISIAFVAPEDAWLAEQRVLLIPSVQPEGLRWQCSAPGLAPGYLPATCRPER
jgi:hypothetical protein